MARLRSRTGLFILIFLAVIIAFLFTGKESRAFDMSQASFGIHNAVNGRNLDMNPYFDPSSSQYTVTLDGPHQVYIKPYMPEDYFFVVEGFRYYPGENSHSITINNPRIIQVRFGNDYGLGPAYKIEFKIAKNNPPPEPPPDNGQQEGGGSTINPIIPGAEINSLDLYLNSLEVGTYTQNGTLSPGFNRANTAYTLNALEGDWLVIRMELGKDVAAVIVDGKAYYGNGIMQVVTLNKSNIEINLIGLKGESRTYTLLFKSPQDVLPQGLPKLVSMAINQGSIPLTPAFSGNINSYLAPIPPNSGRITLNIKGEEGSYTTINNVPRDFMVIDELDDSQSNLLISVNKGGLANYYFLRLASPSLINAPNPQDASLLSIMIIAGDTQIDATKYPMGENSFRIPLPGSAKNIGISAVSTEGATIILGGRSFNNAGFWNYTLPPGGNGDDSIYITVISPDKTFVKTYTLVLYTQKTVVRVLLGSKEVVINDALSHMDAQAYQTEGRVMVPLRFISQALGAEVNWNSAKRQVEIINQGKTLSLSLNQPISGMDVPPEIKDGRTFVPLRYVSQELGANVQWLADEKVVIITK